MSLPTAPRTTQRPILWLLIALLLFAAGLGLRLYDLTDQPIDFHPTRQLRNALVARGIYYQMLPEADPAIRQRAINYGASTGQYEPPIVETIVAYIYRLAGEEQLWLSRLVTSLFWMIGGVALFDLARRLAAPIAGRASPYAAALVALSYYLILPFAVQASRSFQPDPGMVMWIILSVYALYRWSQKAGWGWAIAAGLLGGVAVLTKVVAGYIVGGAALALVLATFGIRRFWRHLQVWVMGLLMLLPSLLYYFGRGGRASEYFASWTLSLSHLLLEPSFYVRWFNLVQSLMGLSLLLLALLGVIIARPSRARALLIGLWGGYAVYGLFLPYQMYTHNYYHLQLVPIIALALVAPAQLLADQLAEQRGWWQAAAALILAGGLAYSGWVSIAEFKREDHRNEPAYWQEIASYLPTDGKIIGLTQDYGYRLEYYGWRKVTLWPTRGDRNLAALRGNEREFETFFQKRTEGKSYFLITAFGQFNDQPDLKSYLNKHYPVHAEGSGYLIYDLEHPLASQ